MTIKELIERLKEVAEENSANLIVVTKDGFGRYLDIDEIEVIEINKKDCVILI